MLRGEEEVMMLVEKCSVEGDKRLPMVTSELGVGLRFILQSSVLGSIYVDTLGFNHG
jgi:hypothetical protein